MRKRGYISSRVHGLGVVLKDKDGVCVLVIHKSNVNKIKKEHLLSCFQKDLQREYWDGTRRILLGQEIGEGASRTVYQHPTNRGLVVKLDRYTYKPDKDLKDRLENQNEQEFKMFQCLKDTGNKTMLNLVAPIEKATSNYFMLTQKKICGVYAHKYEGNSDVGQTTRDTITNELRKEFGEKFACRGHDFHDANIIVTKRGIAKIVDLGYIDKVPQRVVNQQQPALVQLRGNIIFGGI